MEKQTFADLKNDFAFNKTFASEEYKDVLITMLNISLESVLEKPIKDVFIKNPYIKGQIPEDRDSILDIKCEDIDGIFFIVEMQVTEQKYFIKRALYYLCAKVHETGQKGKEWNFDFPQVYSLNFIDFDLPFLEQSDKVLQSFSLHNYDNHEIKLDYINLIFVRLPKFKKSLEECETLLDKLLFTFRHAHEYDKKPEQLAGNFFDKLFELLEFSNFNNMERELYESRLKAARDRYAQNEWAIEKGMQQGKAEAREEIFALLEKGLSLEEIKKQLKS
jgi:predicted transposase/invertase (TIGR01784 family)